MKLGLIAGNGRFPFLLLDAARAQGLAVVVAAIREETDPEIDRRAAEDDHITVYWLSLGELSRLMLQHFTLLAKRNTEDMKWKKFFYRMICRDEGFRICTAPSCSECNDFNVCFGDESGESLLARTRLLQETSKLIGVQSYYAQ